MSAYRVRKPNVMRANWFSPLADDEIIGRQYVEGTNCINAQGDIVIGDALGDPSCLSIGSEGEVLTVESGTAVWKSGLTQKEVFFYVDGKSNSGNYRTKAVAQVGSIVMDFHVPVDFNNLVSVEAVFISNTTNPTANIDLYSDYASIGENRTTHQESDTTSTYNLGTAGNVGSFSLASVFSSLSAGDFCGVTVMHNTIGGTLEYFGIRLIYT